MPTRRTHTRAMFAALAAGLLAAALPVGSASAQNPDVPLRKQDSDPALPPASQVPPDRVRPSPDAPPQDQTLSDRLDRNDGVIKPRSEGAAGAVIRPEAGTGTMPVIKPSELPGREPGTVAK